MDKDIAKLGKRIKNLRVKMGYKSQETFAYEKGLPRAQYGRYEKGVDLRYSSLVKLAKAFEISLEELVKDL